MVLLKFSVREDSQPQSGFSCSFAFVKGRQYDTTMPSRVPTSVTPLYAEVVRLLLCHPAAVSGVFDICASEHEASKLAELTGVNAHMTIE